MILTSYMFNLACPCKFARQNIGLLRLFGIGGCVPILAIEGVMPYMSMEGIMVMWRDPFERTL